MFVQGIARSTLVLLLKALQDSFRVADVSPACAETIDITWGLPATYNLTRFPDVAAVVGDTVTIHWNRTAGGQFGLWKITDGIATSPLKSRFILDMDFLPVICELCVPQVCRKDTSLPASQQQHTTCFLYTTCMHSIQSNA